MQKNCLNYPVEVVKDAFGESPALAELLSSLAVDGVGPKVLIVADMNVVQRIAGLGSRIGKYVSDHGIQLVGNPVVIAAGEKIKADNLQSALTAMAAMLEAKIGRNDVVLAIGGGTLLDVAGYAAAQVRGGVRIVRMPTTPAAMIDAAFADYAAVDSVNVKDALRVPSIPAGVVIDTAFAAGVLDGVWCGGFGEAVRLAVAQSAPLMKKLAKLAPDYARRDIDALDGVLAAVLDVRRKKGTTTLAQWSAARMEAMSGYKLPHGYAIPLGLAIELKYAVAKERLKKADMEMVMECLNTAGASDGIAHSQHFLGMIDSMLFGIDAWRLSTGRPEITVLDGMGKVCDEPEPDREVYKKVIVEALSFPAQA